jgi:uncharacterized membrane protein
VCRKAYRQSVDSSSPMGSFYHGMFVVLVAVLLTMLTDNTATYVFMMAPLGILIGTVLRTQKQLGLETSAGRSTVSGVVRLTSPAVLSPGSQT